MEATASGKATKIVNEKMKPVSNELKIPSPQFYILNAICTSSESCGQLETLNAKYIKELEELLEMFGADCVACAINNLNEGREFSIGNYTVSPTKKKKKE